MKKERNKRIDILKGIAAILVVMGHVIQYASVGDVTFENNVIYNVIYSFHMPLFMLLSGYIAYYSINEKNTINFKDYFLKRLIQLLLPFVIWGIVTAIFVNANDIYRHHSLTGVLSYMDKLFIHPENGLWFLYVLFLLNIIHLVVVRILEKNKMGGVLPLYIIDSALGYSNPKHIWHVQYQKDDSILFFWIINKKVCA